jgi:ribose transport system permease protein
MTATTAAPVEAPQSGVGSGRGAHVAELLQRNGALLVLVLVCLVASLAFDTFATTSNLRNVAVQSSFLALVAFGMTFVILTGGIDLSVGSVYALGGVLVAYGAQYGTVIGLLLPIGACALIGLVQGLVISRGGLPPFIVTLAGLLAVRGLVLLVTDEGAQVRTIPEGPLRTLGRGTLLGLQYSVWIVVIAFLVLAVVLARTGFGQSLYAIGGRGDAARLMGLPVARSTTLVYVLSATLAGAAGALLAARSSSGVPIVGVGVELDAIAAVVIGGTLLTGGAGTLRGTLCGVLLLGVIQNCINLVGSLNSSYQSLVSGAFLVVVVVVQTQLARKQQL